MKVLIFGGTGQVGFELQRAFAPVAEVIVPAPRVDLADFGGLEQAVSDLRPDLVVNAAAYTAVDRAETERELATKINADAPAVLARAATKIEAPFIHYSTDYVFDGQGDRPFNEDDATGPLNHYGASKLAGEVAVRAANPNHLIFRTSWVYAPCGKNFPNTMLRLAQERDVLQVVDDQIGAPTSAQLIANATVQAALRKSDYGTYHLVAGSETSWHGLATAVLTQALDLGLIAKLPEIKAVPSSQFPAGAQRPKNSRLSTEKFRRTFCMGLPYWQTGISDFVQTLAKARG